MHIGQRHHRAHRAGTADHHVGVGHRGGQLVEFQRRRADALLADAGRQPLRARQRAVHDVDVADPGPHQMRHRQPAHRAGADHGGGPPGQPGVQPGAGDSQGDRDHRGAGRVDRGLGVHPLAHRQRALGQVVQHPADGLVGLGRGVGAADLAEHLLLADDRAVQAGGHREQMLDGGLAVADVRVLGQVAHRHAGVLGEHLADHRQTAVEGVDHRVDLDPVAGGQHHRLGHQRRLQHLIDDLGLIGFVGGQLLENRDRRAAMRHPEQQDAHGTITWPAPLLRRNSRLVKLTSTVSPAQAADQIRVRVHRPARSARNRGSSTSQ